MPEQIEDYSPDEFPTNGTPPTQEAAPADSTTIQEEDPVIPVPQQLSREDVVRGLLENPDILSQFVGQQPAQQPVQAQDDEEVPDIYSDPKAYAEYVANKTTRAISATTGMVEAIVSDVKALGLNDVEVANMRRYVANMTAGQLADLYNSKGHITSAKAHLFDQGRIGKVPIPAPRQQQVTPVAPVATAPVVQSGPKLDAQEQMAAEGIAKQLGVSVEDYLGAYGKRRGK